jgi:hypothetical protein
MWRALRDMAIRIRKNEDFSGVQQTRRRCRRAFSSCEASAGRGQPTGRPTHSLFFIRAAPRGNSRALSPSFCSPTPVTLPLGREEVAPRSCPRTRRIRRDAIGSANGGYRW